MQGEVCHSQVRSIKAIDEGDEVTLNYRFLLYSEINMSLIIINGSWGE